MRLPCCEKLDLTKWKNNFDFISRLTVTCHKLFNGNNVFNLKTIFTISKIFFTSPRFKIFFFSFGIFYLKRAFIIHLLSRFKVQSVQTFTQSKVQSFLRAVIRTREGTLGRHEPSLFRLEPPRFSRQTKLPQWRPFLRSAVNEPLPYSTALFKYWFLCVIKNFNIFFDVLT